MALVSGRHPRVLATCAALVVLAGAGASAARAADSPSSGATRVDPGRLTGTWDRYRPSGLQLNPRFTSTIPVPTDPPLKPKYLAQWRARLAASHAADERGQPFYSGYDQCIPDGMPAMMMAMFPLQVLQTPGQITIIEEAYRQVRYIYLDQQQVPIADAEPGFWGHSVGRWDGDTLLVNTVGIKDYVRFHDVPHSDRMQINERIRLVTPDRFEDRITVIDPVYLTKPWTFTWEYQRRPGYKMLEYVCEANREYQDPKTGAQRLQLLDQSSQSSHSAESTQSSRSGNH
ncbi:MAG TPA: hypothetical protein VMD03_07815 [Steroidobacteraceae bacterium]|nr:hypothetical protein [Steroidobacteraceae bacterium]